MAIIDHPLLFKFLSRIPMGKEHLEASPRIHRGRVVCPHILEPLRHSLIDSVNYPSGRATNAQRVQVFSNVKEGFLDKLITT